VEKKLSSFKSSNPQIDIGLGRVDKKELPDEKQKENP
jgi:hypothetical protein